MGYFLSREISWLHFNERVLEEAQSKATPLLERLKFIAIVVSNLDEFFMIRVGSLVDQSSIKPALKDNKTGQTAQEVLDDIYALVRLQSPIVDRTYQELLAEMGERGICHLHYSDLEEKQRRYMRKYFQKEIMPLLSPQIIDPHHPFPHLENCRQHVAVCLRQEKTNELIYGIVPISPVLPKIIQLPGSNSFIPIEEVILKNVSVIFKKYRMHSKLIMRTTRNADLEYIEDYSGHETDFRAHMKQVLKKRRKQAPVRLEFNLTESKRHEILTAFLMEKMQLQPVQCFYSYSPLDPSFAWGLPDMLGEDLRKELSDVPYRARWPKDLERTGIMRQALQHDLLLHYPYDSFMVFLRLLNEAAADPYVVSIKITLYRLGSDSRVISALCDAAENGKEVVAMLELRARFDEQNNINWSTKLEEAGCQIFYGLEDYKIHSKILLITRKSKTGIDYITQLGTGNYNERTATLYSDLCLITSRPEFGVDAGIFFQSITTGVLSDDYKYLLVAPTTYKQGMISLIHKETEVAAAGKSAAIFAKMNGLTDKEIIEALVTAGKAGVEVRLIVRGVCCLCPGIPGVSENIRIVSIVGRFLEHSRIACFGAGRRRKRIFLSSADWMTRNTQRRVELGTPVLDRELAKRLYHILTILWNDNVKTRELGADGLYRLRTPGEAEPLVAQEYFMNREG